MLEQLKRFNADTTAIDETMALAVFAKHLRDEYDKRNMTTPEWLDDAVRRLNRAIESQTRDTKELRLKQIQAERAKLQTPAERREQLEKEEAALNAELTGSQK